MGSQVLKLLLTTRNFWLLSPSSSSELLLPSLATAMATGTGMEDTEAMAAMDMEDTEATTTARGPLMLSQRLRLMLSPPPLLSPAMVTTDTATDTTLTDTGTLLLTPMDITVTTARVTGTALTDTATAMDMEDTEATTTARDLPMLSPAMVTMVMVMEDTEEVITVTAMVTVM